MVNTKQNPTHNGETTSKSQSYRWTKLYLCLTAVRIPILPISQPLRHRPFPSCSSSNCHRLSDVTVICFPAEALATTYSASTVSLLRPLGQCPAGTMTGRRWCDLRGFWLCVTGLARSLRSPVRRVSRPTWLSPPLGTLHTLPLTAPPHHLHKPCSPLAADGLLDTSLSAVYATSTCWLLVYRNLKSKSLEWLTWRHSDPDPQVLTPTTRFGGSSQAS